MEKLLNSLRHTASPSSQWAEGWAVQSQSEAAGGGGRQDPVCAEWSPASLLGAAGSQHPQPCSLSTWIPPPPIHGAWAAERGRATGTEGLLSRRWRGPGDPAGHCQLCVRSAASPLSLGRLRSPTPHFLRPRHLRASQQSWPHVPKKAMIQDREAEPTGCVIQKRGYRQRDFRNKFNFGFPTFSDHKN